MSISMNGNEQSPLVPLRSATGVGLIAANAALTGPTYYVDDGQRVISSCQE